MSNTRWGANFLIGTQVILRPITAEDTNKVIEWRNSQSVQQNFIFRSLLTQHDHEQWLETKVATGSVVQFIIIEKTTGMAVGSVYLRDVDNQNASAEFGIFIGEVSARGKGLGKEATRLILQFAFENLQLHRVSLRVLSGNSAAVHVYETAGFRQEGIFRDMVRLEGEYHDVIFMAVLASEFAGMDSDRMV